MSKVSHISSLLGSYCDRSWCISVNGKESQYIYSIMTSGIFRININVGSIQAHPWRQRYSSWNCTDWNFWNSKRTEQKAKWRIQKHHHSCTTFAHISWNHQVYRQHISWQRGSKWLDWWSFSGCRYDKHWVREKEILEMNLLDHRWREQISWGWWHWSNNQWA